MALRSGWDGHFGKVTREGLPMSQMSATGGKRTFDPRLFDRAVVKRLRDSNTIDQTELVPNERLGSPFPGRLLIH